MSTDSKLEALRTGLEMAQELLAIKREALGDDYRLTRTYWEAERELQAALAEAEQEQAGEAVSSSDGIVSAIDAVEFRREQYDLNCNQRSAILGMLPSHYSEFIHGKRPLPVSAIAQAYAYGVPADALLQQRPTRGASDIDRRLAELEKLRANGITKEPKT